MAFSSEIKHKKIKGLQNMKNEEFSLFKLSKKKQKRSLDDSIKAEDEKKFEGRELSSFTNTSWGKNQVSKFRLLMKSIFSNNKHN